MSSLRNLLFQIHLWLGLIAGIFFILLGLSGSVLVYPNLMASPMATPHATSTGPVRPLEDILSAARASQAQAATRTATISFPRQPGDPFSVQFNAQRNGQQGGRGEGRRGSADRGARREGRGGGREEGEGRGGREGFGGRGGAGGVQVFVDPISAQVLPSVASPRGNGLTGIAHQMHESMLLGPAGRTLVAWLGVGMLFLGLSGLYLWWPRGNQWKYAFIVRRNARGARLYREIHAVFGIWFWIVFLFVTVTALPLGFPGLMALVTGPAQRGPAPGFASATTIAAPDGAVRLPLAKIVTAAEASAGTDATGITVPAQPDRAISVSFRTGEGPTKTVQVDPYTGAILSQPASMAQAALSRGDIEQLHGGGRLGPVWKFLVFLSGFLPLVFVVTGLLMWVKKRQARAAMSRPLDA